jgi:tetratricopeptide (TPR) repeat protein
VQVSPVERPARHDRKPVDPDVYEAFLQGKYYGGQFGEASVRKAKGYFERAIAKDPTFAPAWAGLADALQWLAVFHVDPAQLMPQAETAARRAIELDSGLAEAHASLSEVYMNRWDWASADAAIRRAIELNPGSAGARRRHWLLLVCQLRLDEALQEIELARSLDPLSAQVSANVGVQYLFLGRHEDAIAELEHALQLDPDYALTHVYLFLTYSELKQDPQRGSELQFYIADLAGAELLPEYNRRLGSDGYESALHWLATTLDSNPPRGGATRFGVIAGLLALSGERDKALTWLERGLEQRAWDLGWIAVSPDYASLRSDPRFTAITRRIGLPASAP